MNLRAGGLAFARSVRATAAGAFALTLPRTLTYDLCSTTLVVSATGTTGDAATLKRPPRGCAPG